MKVLPASKVKKIPDGNSMEFYRKNPGGNDTFRILGKFPPSPFTRDKNLLKYVLFTSVVG